MVKKLFRYEFTAWLRSMLPFYITLGAMALTARFVQLFERDTQAYRTVFWSAVALLIAAVIVCLVMTVIMGLVRFYKNLFSSEGYLSFMLPVTPLQHLLTKSLTALGMMLISCAASLLAGAIAASGRPLAEFVKAVLYILRTLGDYFGLSMPFFVLEGFVGGCMFILAAYMFLYFCLCVGQLARKHRILAALGVFLGFYVLAQVLMVVLLVNFDTVIGWAPLVWWDHLFCVMDPPTLPLHIALCAALVWHVLLAAAFTVLSKLILSRRLNLE